MKSNQSIEQAIQIVTNSPSTIFHKDDVLRIISGIEVTKNATMAAEQIEELAYDIAKRISRLSQDIVTIESVTVSAGRYGNNIDDMDAVLDEDVMCDAAGEVLMDYFAPVVEESSQENNLTENQEVTN